VTGSAVKMGTDCLDSSTIGSAITDTVSVIAAFKEVPSRLSTILLGGRKSIQRWSGALVLFTDFTSQCDRSFHNNFHCGMVPAGRTFWAI